MNPDKRVRQFGQFDKCNWGREGGTSLLDSSKDLITFLTEFKLEPREILID